jgi:hypothetical protein
MVVRVVERHVDLTREPAADIVNPDQDPVATLVGDLEPLTVFTSQDKHGMVPLTG